MSTVIEYLDEQGNQHSDEIKVQSMLDAILYAELYKNKKILAVTITTNNKEI